MIVRLLLLIALPVMAYFLVKSSASRFNLSSRQTRYLYFFVVALLVIGILVVLGRLPVQFILAPIGVAATYLLRLLPMVLRLLPMWQMLKGRASSTVPKSEGSVSKIRTRYLAMELDHDSGVMDGEVLQGDFAKRLLSSLSKAELKDFMNNVYSDEDSAQVFEAYMDRNHPNWRDELGKPDSRQTDSRGSEEMTQDIAFEVLGLKPDAGEDEIILAHRQLMQKMHPDRGGSDYLATKINLAKDTLLGGK